MNIENTTDENIVLEDVNNDVNHLIIPANGSVDVLFVDFWPFLFNDALFNRLADGSLVIDASAAGTVLTADTKLNTQLSTVFDAMGLTMFNVTP